MYTHLVLGRGGIKGCVLTGALEAFDTIFNINRIKYIIGSSAGGVVGTMLCIGYTPKELSEIFLHLNLAEYRDIKISNMLSTYGTDDCSKLMRLLKSIIIQKCDYNITFKELYSKTGKTLILTGSNITDIKTVFFSRLTYPDMKVIDALRITLSYPFLFEPIKLNNKYFIDGAALDDYPMDYFKNIKSKIGIILKTKKEKNKPVYNIKNFLGYTGAVIFSIVKKFNNMCLAKNIENTIVIKLPDIHALEFGISYKTKLNLRNIGYNITIKYLNNKIMKHYNFYSLKKYFYILKNYSPDL